MTVGRPLNYYGSKEKLCPVIYSLIPPGIETWVDLFCGSAIVTLKKARHKREVINDLNGDVVNLFQVLRSDRAPELFRLVELTPYAEGLIKEVADTRVPDDAVTKAWRFLVISWFRRNGGTANHGFRWSKGQTTSPELSWARLPTRLAACVERLRGVCIREMDALRLIDDYDAENTLLFVDPPYPGPPGRRYTVKMSNDQHQALAERLARCRARVILTMNPDTVYSQVLTGWHVHAVAVQGGGQQTKPEVILTNYEPLPLLGVGAA